MTNELLKPSQSPNWSIAIHSDATKAIHLLYRSKLVFRYSCHADHIYKYTLDPRLHLHGIGKRGTMESCSKTITIYLLLFGYCHSYYMCAVFGRRYTFEFSIISKLPLSLLARTKNRVFDFILHSNSEKLRMLHAAGDASIECKTNRCRTYRQNFSPQTNSLVRRDLSVQLVRLVECTYCTSVQSDGTELFPVNRIWKATYQTELAKWCTDNKILPLVMAIIVSAYTNKSGKSVARLPECFGGDSITYESYPWLLLETLVLKKWGITKNRFLSIMDISWELPMQVWSVAYLVSPINTKWLQRRWQRLFGELQRWLMPICSPVV